MSYRMLPLFLAAVALTLFFGLPALADDKAKDADGDTHMGTVVKVEGNKLIMKDKDGKEHTHTLGKDIRYTLDNKQSRVEDLKPGMKIRVTSKKGDKDTIVQIEALDKEKDFPKIDKP